MKISKLKGYDEEDKPKIRAILERPGTDKFKELTKYGSTGSLFTYRFKKPTDCAEPEQDLTRKELSNWLMQKERTVWELDDFMQIGVMVYDGTNMYCSPEGKPVGPCFETSLEQVVAGLKGLDSEDRNKVALDYYLRLAKSKDDGATTFGEEEDTEIESTA